MAHAGCQDYFTRGQKYKSVTAASTKVNMQHVGLQRGR